MKDSWSPTLQSQQSCSWSTQTSHPCRLWAEQESSPFLHPAPSYQNHYLYATVHCCSNRETEGAYKDREILNYFQGITSYVSSSGLLQSPRWTTEHLREIKGTKYLVLIVLMLWLPALALSAPRCRNSALMRIEQLGFVSPFCASPFPEGTTAVLCHHWVLRLYCGSALQTDTVMTEVSDRIKYIYIKIHIYIYK